ncbi:hypothetical protein BKA61DRAFT_646292 [Leptodontidium sp. MPI-SDFR-AT-0119]|nr:hypothetical protein BKA61DRAFT_646292 [Leptodontidium sp. MPI-SDFR-AT-0119]
MAGFVDVRGSGLARAQRALAALEDHPERLDRERRRFSNSPPPYKSDTSGTTTRSQSPNPPTEEQRLRQQRRMQLAGEREASEPGRQFKVQVEEERRRIWNTEPRTGWMEVTVDLYTFKEEARETVKKRWKHEEPLELESESETDTEAESSRPRFSFLSIEPKPRRPKSDEEKRLIAERTVIREPNPLVNSSHDAPPIRLFGSPPTDQSNHRQLSGPLTSSGEGPQADIASAGSENDDVERPHSSSNSPPRSSGKEVLRATTGQALLPSKRKAAYEDGQPANASLGPIHSSKVTTAAGKRTGPPRRLNISQKVSSDSLPLSSGVDAAEPQPSPPPNHVTPRRSKRIQLPVSSVAKDPAKTASTAPSKRAVQSKPERKVASNPTARASAKPQGVFKKEPAKTARGRQGENEQLHT